MAEATNQQPVAADVTRPHFSPTEFAAFCMLKLNRASEAEALLAKATEGCTAAGREYYLGIALARQGKLREAIHHLQNGGHHPAYAQPAAQALLALLKREARRLQARHDYEEAAQALSQALDIAPSDPELQAMLDALGVHMPVAYIKGKQHAKAAEAWEQEQRRNPTDGKLTHCLALVYFWVAQTLERQGNWADADSAWRGAIRNCVALCYCDRFWAEWRAGRERVYGAKVRDAAVEGLRKSVQQMVRRQIADFRNEYLKQGQAEGQRRMERLDLEMAAELKTADALKRVADSLARQGRTAQMPPFCGVLMLKHLGQLEVAQKLLALVQTTQTNEASTERLRWCLSPWVFAWVMVQERRCDEAIAWLQKELKKNASSQDCNDLMAIAMLERGKALSGSGDIMKAVNSWKAALKHVRARKKTADEIKKTAEEESVKHATRLADNEGLKGIETAIKMLEQVRGFADTKGVRFTLSEMFRFFGVAKWNNAKNTSAKEEGVSFLRKALKLSPDNGQVKSTLSGMLSSLGVSLYNEGHHSRGLAFLDEAIEIDPSNDHARDNRRRGRGY
jgi:tetratricopeptide (TPR) repeat protein